MRRYYRRRKKTSLYFIFALLFFCTILLKERPDIFPTGSSDITTKAVILVLILPIGFAMFKVFKDVVVRNHYVNKSHSQIDAMSGEDFERFLKAHFEKQGYSVKTTPQTNDYGVDLICSKGGVKIAVQAKRYKGKVGVSAVQQAVAGMNYYSCNNSMVATNSYFSSNAWELAKRSNVTLWDRDKITEIFNIKVDKL